MTVPPGSMHAFGRNLVGGNSPLRGDVDFVCLNKRWYKVVGPVSVTDDARIVGFKRAANAAELKTLPPCTDGPCPCPK
jgi:hypothetical protein